MHIRHSLIIWFGWGLLITAQAQSGGASVAASNTRAEPSPGVCLLADFRALALTTHEPAQRLEMALDWMKQHARQCSIDQLKVLNNYRPSWMGAADHPKLQGMIDSLIEARTANDPEKLKALFTPEVSPPPVETQKSFTAKPIRTPATTQPMPMLNPMIQGYVQPPLPVVPPLGSAPRPNQVP
jgi:hypothetical protein